MVLVFANVYLVKQLWPCCFMPILNTTAQFTQSTHDAPLISSTLDINRECVRFFIRWSHKQYQLTSVKGKKVYATHIHVNISCNRWIFYRIQLICMVFFWWLIFSLCCRSVVRRVLLRSWILARYSTVHHDIENLTFYIV